MTLHRSEPEHDPCPMGCGRTTDDVAGGPCSACWDDAPGAGHCQMCGTHKDDPCECFDPQGDPRR